jgi:hypothetical protein
MNKSHWVGDKQFLGAEDSQLQTEEGLRKHLTLVFVVNSLLQSLDLSSPIYDLSMQWPLDVIPTFGQRCRRIILEVFYTLTYLSHHFLIGILNIGINLLIRLDIARKILYPSFQSVFTDFKNGFFLSSAFLWDERPIRYSTRSYRMYLTNSSDMTSNLYLIQEGWFADNRFPPFCLKESNPPLYPQQATIERIDDIPLLWALQQRIHLSNIIDAAIPRHWSHQGLSIGQLVLAWNTFILSQGHHRKVTVRSWVTPHQSVLEELLGQPIRDTDFTDDRLGQVLTALSHDQKWQTIEDQLWRQSVMVYSLTPHCVRLDATTATGLRSARGRLSHGHRGDFDAIRLQQRPPHKTPGQSDGRPSVCQRQAVSITKAMDISLPLRWYKDKGQMLPCINPFWSEYAAKCCNLGFCTLAIAKCRH